MSIELKGLLGDKYTPTTHDYCLGTRRAAHTKVTKGWTVTGEMVNHEEHIVVLARPKAAEQKHTTPGLLQRAVNAVRGTQ